MENLKYFKELSEFSAADSAGVITTSKFPYIVITVGISGSGKSTWRDAFITEMKDGVTPFVYISPDMLRKELTGDISNQSKNNEVWNKVKKQFACVTKEEALVNYKTRKKYQIKILERKLDMAKLGLEIANSNELTKTIVSPILCNQLLSVRKDFSDYY